MNVKEIAKLGYLKARSEFDKLPSRCEDEFNYWWNTQGCIDVTEITIECGVMADNPISESDTKALHLHGVMPCAYLIQSKNTLLIHGLFSSLEKAEKYRNGSPNMAITKVNIA